MELASRIQRKGRMVLSFQYHSGLEGECCCRVLGERVRNLVVVERGGRFGWDISLGGILVYIIIWSRYGIVRVEGVLVPVLAFCGCEFLRCLIFIYKKKSCVNVGLTVIPQIYHSDTHVGYHLKRR